jgi:hypothetical protein
MVRGWRIVLKNHGMEYRTPGSWCLSPSVTLVTLTLAKLSALAVVEDDLNLKEIKGTDGFRVLPSQTKNLSENNPHRLCGGIERTGDSAEEKT